MSAPVKHTCPDIEQTVIQVTGCNDCRLKHVDTEQGWVHCNAPVDLPEDRYIGSEFQWYDKKLATPTWCPLKTNPITIQLTKSE